METTSTSPRIGQASAFVNPVQQQQNMTYQNIQAFFGDKIANRIIRRVVRSSLTEAHPIGVPPHGTLADLEY